MTRRMFLISFFTFVLSQKKEKKGPKQPKPPQPGPGTNTIS